MNFTCLAPGKECLYNLLNLTSKAYNFTKKITLNRSKQKSFMPDQFQIFERVTCSCMRQKFEFLNMGV